MLNGLKKKTYIADHGKYSYYGGGERKGNANLAYRTREELDLINQADVKFFLEPRDLIKFI